MNRLPLALCQEGTLKNNATCLLPLLPLWRRVIMGLVKSKRVALWIKPFVLLATTRQTVRRKRAFNKFSRTLVLQVRLWNSYYLKSATGCYNKTRQQFISRKRSGGGWRSFYALNHLCSPSNYYQAHRTKGNETRKIHIIDRFNIMLKSTLEEGIHPLICIQ